ncbi:MAG TPA: glycerol-3-phosphate dehydrogenase [Burkholderiales bacterium]|nr:glycerol-3-phosphate dehydrogenase [Burkholderiales bacterium]
MLAALPDTVDLLVVGGGINGVGIARDAAGRGLSVLLVDKGDLGGATSSASSKLVHGGLRYLEQYEFRLVAEALAEREVLLKAAPHIVRAMPFVMPHVPTLRPAWMIRAGLLLYDYLARRQTLPRARPIDLASDSFGSGLKPGLRRGFLYSDCWVDDARLVILTARAAADLGATIAPRTACIAAHRRAARWEATLCDAGGAERAVAARALVNVTGPWAKSFLEKTLGLAAPFDLKLVQGSHILVPRLFPQDHAFILQNDDRRVIFVYGYEGCYTLIGTTESEVHDPDGCSPTPAEVDYLVAAANRYFERQIAAREVAWRYCGIRPLYDDGAANPSAISRDYVFRIDGRLDEAPVLSVFGGKITTYRRLAEHALEKFAPWFRDLRPAWTRACPLPGGDLGMGFAQYAAALTVRYPRLPAEHLLAIARRHGTLTERILGNAQHQNNLGMHFGGGLYAREIDYFVEHEWAHTAEDVLWRRTKMGLHLASDAVQAVTAYIAQRRERAVR